MLIFFNNTTPKIQNYNNKKKQMYVNAWLHPWKWNIYAIYIVQLLATNIYFGVL